MNEPYQIVSGLTRCISIKTLSRISGGLTGCIAGRILLFFLKNLEFKQPRPVQRFEPRSRVQYRAQRGLWL